MINMMNTNTRLHRRNNLLLMKLLFLLPVACCLEEVSCYDNGAYDDDLPTNATTTSTSSRKHTSIVTTTSSYTNSKKYPCNADLNPWGSYHSSCPDKSCPFEIYNSKLHADNVIEVNLDMDVVAKLRKYYEDDVEPRLGYSTDDICYVDPYHPSKQVWAGHAEQKYRSNAKWYSMRSYKAYQKYEKIVEELGLLDLFKGTWIDSPKVHVYGMFFLKRNHSLAHHIHWDWQEEINTQLITFLVPVKGNDIGLAYYDNDGVLQHYNYQPNKGVGFAGGFMHSTDVGSSEEDNVLFSIYMGGEDVDIYELWQSSSSDELENHMHPIDGWVKNPMKVEAEFCLPSKQQEEDKKRQVIIDDDDEYSLGNLAIDMQVEQLAMMIHTMKRTGQIQDEEEAIDQLRDSIRKYK